MRDGYIYIHDMSARRDTMNCCLFNVQEVLKGGFEMGNLWYNEPKTLDVAFDVIGDIVLSAASQQYGGFTVPNIELILEPYAEKSYEAGIERYEGLGLSRERAEEEALKDVKREFEQGFQGLEYKFNSVSSSRGDYPFITMTAGTGSGNEEDPKYIKIKEHIPADRWGERQDLMGAMVFLASKAADYVNGTLLVVDGGYLVR